MLLLYCAKNTARNNKMIEQINEKIPPRKLLTFAAGMGLVTTGIFGSTLVNYTISENKEKSK
jgi:hypothetical protein